MLSWQWRNQWVSNPRMVIHANDYSTDAPPLAHGSLGGTVVSQSVRWARADSGVVIHSKGYSPGFLKHLGAPQLTRRLVTEC
jgi:hypothetical protein